MNLEAIMVREYAVSLFSYCRRQQLLFAIRIGSSANADKPARRTQRSLKVTKHSTIPYVRYFSSCAIVTLSLRLAVSPIFDFKKCDLKVRVRGHSRSLKVVSFDRLCMVSYQCSLVTLSLKCTVFEIFDFKNAVTLKTRSSKMIPFNPAPMISY